MNFRIMPFHITQPKPHSQATLCVGLDGWCNMFNLFSILFYNIIIVFNFIVTVDFTLIAFTF